MIHVVVTGPPKTGFYPYRVDWWMQGRQQIVGAWPLPLFDACRKLKQMGLMDSTVVGLFEEGDPKWKFRTTVGYGAQHWVEPVVPNPTGDYREFHVKPLTAASDQPPIDAPPARQGEPPRPPHTRPRPRADTGPAVEAPDTLKKSHRRQKRGASGARRGSR